MNWYKIAQQLDIIENMDIQGKGRNYTDYGHDAYSEEDNKLLGRENKNYNKSNPNIMWIYHKGEIETKPEIGTSIAHRSENAWGLQSYLDRLYTGRYSPSERVISVIPPHEGASQFRDIPGQLQSLLKQKFPESIKIISYAESKKVIKIAQKYPPIAITSYIGDNLGITFNGGKKYNYENVPPILYDRIDGLLRNRNYGAVQKILQNLSPKNEETEQDKQEMLRELYDRGILS